MKRFFIILLVVVFIAAIPLSHNLMAKAKAEKVRLCHITHLTEDGNGYTVHMGHVIVVSINAAPAHCAHGDHDIPTADKKAGDPCGWNMKWGSIPCKY